MPGRLLQTTLKSQLVQLQ